MSFRALSWFCQRCYLTKSSGGVPRKWKERWRFVWMLPPSCCLDIVERCKQSANDTCSPLVISGIGEGQHQSTVHHWEFRIIWDIQSDQAFLDPFVLRGCVTQYGTNSRWPVDSKKRANDTYLSSSHIRNRRGSTPIHSSLGITDHLGHTKRLGIFGSIRP